MGSNTNGARWRWRTPRLCMYSSLVASLSPAATWDGGDCLVCLFVCVELSCLLCQHFLAPLLTPQHPCLKEFEPQSQSWSLRTSSFVRDFQWLSTSHKSCFGEYWAGVHGLVCTTQPTFITTARLGLEPLEGQSILGHAREATATFPPSLCSFRSAEKVDYS